MKRLNNLFEEIVSYQNLRLAWINAIRGKRKSYAVLLFSRNIDANLQKIKLRLESLNQNWGNYRTFVVLEPKERVINSASFSERVMHHAIMNILAPIFERQFIYHTYACRKGKGTYSAVEYAFHICKSKKYFLKLDARKYFDSIDHLVLKAQLTRLIKDDGVLHLLFGVIDSYHTLPGKGVPIGNLTSQFFANLYLSSMDHFILEHLKPAGYVRYMDDFLLWHNDKIVLQTMLANIQAFFQKELKLELKAPVLDKTEHGLPFLGFLIKPGGIFLLRKSKRRMRAGAKLIHSELFAGEISEEEAAVRATSINAAVLVARCRSFRRKLWRESANI